MASITFEENPQRRRLFDCDLEALLHFPRSEDRGRVARCETPIPLRQQPPEAEDEDRPERRVVQASVLTGLLPVVRDIRRIGSAALDLCWVANGRFDAYYESGLHYWDWAAGSVICKEAGGQLATLPGEILLATTPELMAPLTDLLARAQAAPGQR